MRQAKESSKRTLKDDTVKSRVPRRSSNARETYNSGIQQKSEHEQQASTGTKGDTTRDQEKRAGGR